jgi:hypothetical protein
VWTQTKAKIHLTIFHLKTKILKFFVSLLILLSVLLFSFYLWFIHSWKSIVPEKEMQNFSTHIREAKPLPDSLVRIFEAVYPNGSNTSFTKELMNRINSGLFTKNWSGLGECYCDDILKEEKFLIPGREGYVNSDLDAYRLTFGLESMVGDSICFAYYLRKNYHDIQMVEGNNGCRFITKKIDELNREEFIEFLIIKEAPGWYNKFRYPERFNARKKVIEKKLQEARI